MISADVVAAAIVAACKETGEDPIACARGEERVRARHYAMHALIRVFPEVERKSAARMVGARGKPQYFHKNSLIQTANPLAGFFKAKWWSAVLFNRVIDATFDAAEFDPEEVRTRRTGGQTQTAAHESSLPPAPALTAKPSRPPPPFAVSGKKGLYDMLTESVRNTAAMTPRRED
jgi:hypothetical protein